MHLYFQICSGTDDEIKAKVCRFGWPPVFQFTINMVLLATQGFLAAGCNLCGTLSSTNRDLLGVLVTIFLLSISGSKSLFWFTVVLKVLGFFESPPVRSSNTTYIADQGDFEREPITPVTKDGNIRSSSYGSCFRSFGCSDNFIGSLSDTSGIYSYSNNSVNSYMNW